MSDNIVTKTGYCKSKGIWLQTLYTIIEHLEINEPWIESIDKIDDFLVQYPDTRAFFLRKTYDKKNTKNKLARTYNITHQTIFLILEKLQIENKSLFTENEYEKIISYIESFPSKEDMTKYHRVSRNKEHLKTTKYKDRIKGINKERFYLDDLYLTRKEIIRQLKCSPSILNKIIYIISPSYKENNSRGLNYNIHEIKDYLDKNSIKEINKTYNKVFKIVLPTENKLYSTKEIRDIFNITPKTVIATLKELDIKPSGKVKQIYDGYSLESIKLVDKFIKDCGGNTRQFFKEKTCMEKYGVKSYTQTDSYKEQYKKTSQERYGYENVFKNKEIQDKIIKNRKEKTGYGYPTQNPKVKEKIKESCLTTWGETNPMKSEKGKRLLEDSLMAKYGVRYISQNKDIVKKSILSRRNNVISFKEKYLLKHNIKLYTSKDLAKIFNRKYGVILGVAKDISIEGIFHKGTTFFTESDKNKLQEYFDTLYKNKSKGEFIIQEYLKNNNIKFEYQKRFKECRDKNTLSFDFCLPDNYILIEFNGIQHYEEVKFFHRDKEAFERQINHDLIKKEFAIKKGYRLLEIKYDDNIEERLLEI